jgi:NAD(P)-dependent dehydrogenase (short-subunit alcohol dehydrogenase family)
VNDDHAGRAALVTGGSSGIGRACARLLAAAGAAVAVNGIDADEVRQTVDEILAAGGKAIPVVADVSDSAAITAAVHGAAAELGGLDILVTSAGIQRYGTVADTEEQVWDEVFAVNVKGVFLTARAALPYLRRSEAAAVVVVSSVQAKATQTNVAAYAAGKGALNALVRSMAVDEARHGVRVNAVCPASVDTPMLRSSAQLFGDGSAQGAEQLLAAWGRAHPLGRVGRPDEVAEVVSFLAGPRAAFVTGTEILVDGGLLATIGVTLPEDGGESTDAADAAAVPAAAPIRPSSS